MSSVLDRPRFRDRITDDDWKTGDTSTASTQRMMLVSWPKTVRPFLQKQLLVEWDGPLPDWFEQAIASLNELGDLDSNWDSYGAKRIRHSSIVASIKLLLCVMAEDTPFPAVVPTNRGTVMLEWHTAGIDLEVEVLGDCRLHVAFADARDGTEWEADIGSDLSQLVHCIERLSERERARQ